MMANYKMIIQYDGGRYKGWQRLGGEENTIQGKIENVLSEMAGTKIEIIGSSRTDAGVHALAQTANFHLEGSYSENEIMEYLNRYLPQDICITHVKRVPEDFHARYNAKQKTYLYKIWNKRYPNPFMRKYSMHVDQPLDIPKMQKAAGYFIGQHDFTALSNAKSRKKSMVREIYTLDISEGEGGLIEIRVCGNGFLYNMVRRMVGVLIETGLGRIPADSVPDIITSGERNKVGLIADPCGLYLEEITF
jgi:tRNA pseudouridine38-40 synthase